jgi:hypothetical protein
VNLCHRTIFLFFLLIFIPSCKNSYFISNKVAKLLPLSSVSKKAFSFVVSEELINSNSSHKPSSLYPKMNVAELELLMKLMRNQKYCINSEGDLSFKINSKQEKIYDVTFSSLIEQSYNAKPVSPTTYFGECL